jgi:hypothetical protein
MEAFLPGLVSQMGGLKPQLKDLLQRPSRPLFDRPLSEKIVNETGTAAAPGRRVP